MSVVSRRFSSRRNCATVGASAPRASAGSLFDDFVAGEQEFEGLRGIEALILARLVVGHGEQRARAARRGR